MGLAEFPRAGPRIGAFASTSLVGAGYTAGPHRTEHETRDLRASTAALPGAAPPPRAMKIVYGVAGEGLGHVFEAIEMVARLRREGHSVKVLTFGERALGVMRDLDPTRIEGIQLYFGRGGLSLPATVRRNLRCIPFYMRNWRRLRRELEGFAPDAFITAYEPFTTFASHRLHRPLISMDNQNELLYMRAPRGPGSFDFRLARLATRVCTHGAAHYIVKSFDRTPRGGANVHFVYPVVQGVIRELRPSDEGHILVYLTKPNPGLVRVLNSMDGRFIVYCNNRVGEEGNVTYRAQGPQFPKDLGSCRAIIATAGFSLIADSVYLRKPYFAVPLRRQFEQTHNAQFLLESGLGEACENPGRAELEGFLGRLDVYRERLARYRIDPAEQEEKMLELLRIVRAA